MNSTIKEDIQAVSAYIGAVGAIVLALVAVLAVALHSQGCGLAPCYDKTFLIDGKCNDYRQELRREGLFWTCRCGD
jgi:hypothetical protein